jgi:hypothetical protein
MFAKSTSFLFVLLSQIAFAQVTIERPDIIETQKSYRNYIKNPTALKNLNGTSTSSAALTRDTDTADKLDGVASFNCDTSASGGYCLWQTNTIQEGDKSGNCEASIAYKGDASLYSLRVTDGTNTLIEVALGNKTDWTNEWVNYPCGSTRDVRLVQTTAGTSAAVNIGRIYYGQATGLSRIQSGGQWVGSAKYAATALCAFLRSSATYGNFTADTDCPTMTVAGGLSYSGSKIPGYIVNQVLPGRYEHVCTGVFWSSTTSNYGFRFTDGTTTFGENGGDQQGSAVNVGSFGNIHGSISYSAPQTNVTYQIQGKAATVNHGINVTSDAFECNVYYFPDQSLQAIRADQTNYGWTSYTPTFTGFGTVSTYNCRHKRDGEDLLIKCTFTSGTPTAVEARVSLPGSLVSKSNLNTVELAGFLDFDSSASTIWHHNVLIEPSVGYVTFGAKGSSAAPLTKQTASSQFSNGIKLSFEARIPIEGWTENQKAPVLVGSVTSAATSALRVEFVAFGGSTADNSSCTTTPCTIWRQSGAVSSVSRTSAGVYVVNWVSGTWSSIPTCTYTADATESRFGTSPLPTVSAQPLITRNSSFAFSDASNNYLVCEGPR